MESWNVDAASKPAITASWPSYLSSRHAPCHTDLFQVVWTSVTKYRHDLLRTLESTDTNVIDGRGICCPYALSNLLACLMQCMHEVMLRLETHKWQKPLMNFDLYSMSAAISIRLMRYMSVKNFRSSDFVVVTVVPGGSI